MERPAQRPMPGPAPLAPLARGFMAVGLAVMAIALLYFGRGVIVPVVEALVVVFVLNAVANAIRRVPGIGPRIPWSVALLAAALLAFAVGFWAVQGSVRAVSGMGPQFDGFREGVGPAVEQIAGLFGMSGQEVLDRVVGVLGLEAAVRQIVAATAATISHFSIVAIYVAFILVDQQFLDRKLDILIRDPASRARTRGLLGRIAGGIQSYLLVMTALGVLTAAVSYGVMLYVGVEYAGFLAIAIFFLNFIPTIGSILGTVLPAAAALVQFQAFAPTAVVLAGVGMAQFVIGNIILPRVAGGALNISLAVTIFALFFWGALWGVTGMFVALPLTAMLIIAFSHFEATRPLAILLSRTGEIEAPEPR